MSEFLSFTNDSIKKKVENGYNYYLELFQESKNYIDGIEIYRQRFPAVDGFMDKSYFHMITKEYKEGTQCHCPRNSIICEHPFDYNPLIKDRSPREICPNRILALPSLTDFFNNELLIWENITSSHGQKRRIVCYDTKNDYVIVLEKRSGGEVYLITGYPVEFRRRKEMLMKQYNEYQKNCKHEYLTSSKRQ